MVQLKFQSFVYASKYHPWKVTVKRIFARAPDLLEDSANIAIIDGGRLKLRWSSRLFEEANLARWFRAERLIRSSFLLENCSVQAQL